MDSFSNLLNDMPEFKAIKKGLEQGETPVCVVGSTGSQKSHLIYAISKALCKKCLIVVPDESDASYVADDLSFFLGKNVPVFKTKEYIFYDVDISTRHGEISRLGALSSLEECDAVVCSVASLMQYTIPRDKMKKYSYTLNVGSVINQGELIESLNIMGYKREHSVEGIGQFSVRGSIFDIFSPVYDSPIRIEFFDDEVDSIRFFDPYTQISTEKTDTAKITPVREMIFDDKEKEIIKGKIAALKNENLHADIDKIEECHYFASLDKYFPLVYDEFPTLLDYIDDDFMIFFDEPNRCFEKSKIFYEEQNEIVASMMEKGLFPKVKGEYLKNYSYIASMAEKHPVVLLSALSYSCPEFSPKALMNITAKTLNSYNIHAQFLFDDIEFWKKSGYRVILLFSNDERAKNFANELSDRGIESSFKERLDSVPREGQIFLSLGHIEKGFEYPTIKTVVICDSAFLKKDRKKKRSSNSKDRIKSFEDLNVGDYVVHNTHGIGQYVGIQQLVVDKVTKDYIKIKYKKGDNLYVPANQLDSIHKYIGAESKNVKLSSLGGSDWQKTKTRVKKSVSALAEDLIRLYAKRRDIKGKIFSPDTPWQKEFEEAFPYKETADQLKCIEEVKNDMELGKSMDRLLCGDVGYGKTEVAMRAAFKCVMDSMQVAYLVPTTILAQQHYSNFAARMKDFGVEVEMLSRFRSKKQQEEILKKLKAGSIDIIIGTHRLLQKDVVFKNLGLLIIDEEQRFGVGHKEKIKEMKNDVDVLTLSATPIPRTLHMAMVGIRDLSVIAEPPEDRFPVQTFVLESNDAVIQNAIERELARGGQVYYLYNRVEGIEKKAIKIKSQLPDDVRVEVAHGKMSETQLENIMMRLLGGEIDILVCTTIIETGLDVSNVNTIIIEDADRLGLSQLYQLRGRVGRSNRLAYAYLTYKKDKVLDQTAQKRLQAVKEFTEFGSGFKIALRDLEIRGAGNLLGKEQHGNMNLVGYDMYCHLLEQAVKELKGETVKEKCEIVVDLNVDAYIPKKYISDEIQRIDMYKHISSIENDDDYLDVQSEIIDRYGDIPPCVINLLNIALIKAIAESLNISEITQKDGMIVFTFEDKADPKAIVEIINEYRGKIMFSSGEKSYLSYRYDKDIIGNVKIILQKLVNVSHE